MGIDTKDNKVVIDAGDMSGDLESAAIDTRHINMLAFQMISTGSPNGSYELHCSEDGENFTAVTLDPDPFTVTAAGQDAIGGLLWPHAWAKLKFVFSSGTGSLTASMSLKRAV